MISLNYDIISVMKKIINDSKTKRLGNTFIFKDTNDDIMIDSLKNNEQFTMQ